MKYYRTAEDIAPRLGLDAAQTQAIAEIIARYPMQIPEYYLSLAKPGDPEDPIYRMCVPAPAEADLAGSLDTSGEGENTRLPGMQHKYAQTVLILASGRCAMYCRHCFRRRLVGRDSEEAVVCFEPVMAYIEAHHEVTNVLLSGGDALLLPNRQIARYLERLCAIPHLDFIRFGTRLPVVLPQRISGDRELLDLLAQYASRKEIYVVTQFNHPRELTPEACYALSLLRAAGVHLRNQTVLLRGVNDDPQTLVQLLRALTRHGVMPYYIFQCRPVAGVMNRFQVPLCRGLSIVEEAKGMLSGPAKALRYCMSHPRGKIEIIGMAPDGALIFRFHQARAAADRGRVFLRPAAPDLCWLDDDLQSLSHDAAGCGEWRDRAG